MNMPMLLFVSVAAGFAPQSAAQEARQPKEPIAGARSGSRVPVDVSLEGLGGGSSMIPLTTAVSCLDSIKNKATGGCLMASSRPTFGMLFPYPGANNVSSGQNSFVGSGFNNIAGGQYSFVGGGEYNQAIGGWSTVGGGRINTASDGFGYDQGFATVGGGVLNIASGIGVTVGGGLQNRAFGFYSAVGGGIDNTASGNRATVAGGGSNAALGGFSFAAGRRAKANHNGAFVWGDGQNLDKTSSAPDEFNVYCSGGARLFSNSSATTGVLLAPGGGSWSAVSDRASKENVEPVDGRAVLERVVSLPLSTWNYKAQDDSIRHIGPMAQDFYAAFGLGVNDTLIDTIDPDGVALAAIQGLHALVEERDAEIAELRERLERLEALTEGR